MKSAQKIKLIPMLLLLWALPLSTLPQVAAKPRAPANRNLKQHLPLMKPS